MSENEIEDSAIARTPDCLGWGGGLPARIQKRKRKVAPGCAEGEDELDH